MPGSVPRNECLDIRVVQDDLGDEGTGLKVSAPLAFEQVAFGADHGTALKQCGQIRPVALLAQDPATVQQGLRAA
jgi:hypothetical protein